MNEKSENPFQTQSDFNYLPLLVGITVVFVTLILFLLWQRRKGARRDILITGLSDAGKTLLYSQLVHSQSKDTHTSIAVNVDEYITKNASVRVVDIPGHERLRGRFFDDYKDSARGIVFVVDSTTLHKDIRDVAEYLYTILSDKSVTSNAPQVLILCNKQDLHMAKGSSIIKALLEKEMNLVRVTKTRQLESVDPTSSENVFLGKQGKDFEFSQLIQNIDFAESSAVSTEEKSAQLDQLTKWISRIA